jgi:NitT/TauT family transport system permease protein
MSRMYPSPEALRPHRAFSRWDLVVIPGFLVLLLLLTVGLRGATQPFGSGTPDLAVTLDPAALPYYGLRSLLRMAAALFGSLLFTFVYATVAVKVPRTEKVLIPVLDFLQSLPILGFLTVTTAIFLGVFRGSVLGLEAASVFAIFTSQVWNMTFSFYASLVTVPRELKEAAAAFRLSGWQRFWRLEVPYAMPGLVWNAMMSVSGGWFFVVASEVISVVGRDRAQSLPGIGAYVALAIEQADVRAMLAAALALLALVIVYDQLFFRPLVAWADKFKFEQSGGHDKAESWVLTALERAPLANRVARVPAPLWEWLWLKSARGDRPGVPEEPRPAGGRRARVLDGAFTLLVALGAAGLVWGLASFMFGPGLGIRDGRLLRPNLNVNPELSLDLAKRFAALGVPVGPDRTVWLSDVCTAAAGGAHLGPALATLLRERGVSTPADLAATCAAPLAPAGKVSLPEGLDVATLGLITALRVTGLVLLVTLVWTPLAVWVGLRPRMARVVQPLAQFGAAFPANLLFPLFVVAITRLRLSPEIWLSPLMVLGTQWYVLFNVVAGTTALPNDLKEAARVSRLSGALWWRRLILPGIFPAFVTGGITATGGSWNASIVAERVSWGSTTLVATGLGAYIARWSTGEFNPHVAVGMLAMGILVLTYNRCIWRPLYRLAEARYRLD